MPRIDYLCVLDFEATCDESKPAPYPQEIIEFPTLLLNVSTGEVEREFHHYVRPDVHPTLTEFCTELTGITQDVVDGGIPLDRAIFLHQQWINDCGIVPCTDGADEESATSKPTFLYLTCGDWDLKTCLPAQLCYHGVKVPSIFKLWLNVKREFQNFYGVKTGSMTAMLRQLGIALEGRHHSGIDDCRNTARICQRMLSDGWVPGDASKRAPSCAAKLLHMRKNPMGGGDNGGSRPCRLIGHEGQHSWKECPNNPKSKSYQGTHYSTLRLASEVAAETKTAGENQTRG